MSDGTDSRTDPTRLRVGFVGVGDMGGPMVWNLVANGFETLVFDIRASAVAAVVERGAVAASSLQHLVDETDVVQVCVVNDKQLREVTIGSNGLVQLMREGQFLMVHSTVLPATIEAIGEVAAERGVRFVDAAVSGARVASEAGTLTMLVGGTREDFDALQPVLAAVGERIFHVGSLGSSMKMKIVNNVMLHGNHSVMLEALRLAIALELDEDMVIDVVRVSSGNSWLVEHWPNIDSYLFAHTLSGTEEAYDLMSKEQWNALVLARENHIGLPVTAVATQVYRAACREREDVLRARGFADAIEQRS